MCGITGFISKDLEKKELELMTNALSHRGPDAEGYYFNPENGVGLGHRRLSILDLSNTANQPIYSHCGNFIIVFNGEVYNFKELARELDIVPKTNSDTEIILEGYLKLGADFIQKMNGMFAIAIYDIKNNSLILMRDRLGIKPLFIYRNETHFIFASELKSIKTLPINFTLNQRAISSYFHLGFIDKNESIYEEIIELPPGNYGILQDKELQITPYWKIEEQVKKETITDYKTAKNQLQSLLESSINYRLISDVPVGTFLSGGTDSSIVTAIASKLSSSPISTFSIGFKENKFNESEHAKRVATFLGTNHHEFMLGESDALNVLEEVMGNFDQPFVDSSAIPTYLVSSLAKKHATVALSGDGGDELFMGYGTYNWGNRLNKTGIWHSRKLIAKALKTSNNSRNKRASMVFDAPDRDSLKEHIFSQEQYLFSSKELEELLVNPLLNTSSTKFTTKRNLSFNEKQSLFELTNYLPNDLLTKVDRSAMLSSLEVRVPLLDHRIVEFALNIDSTLKINSKTQKYLLKEVLYDHVPKNILDHPKWGFSIPLGQWLKQDLKYLIDTYLNEEMIMADGIFNYQYVSSLKEKFFNGQDYLYHRIWQIIVFNKFLHNARN